jgi:hypothetical protein
LEICPSRLEGPQIENRQEGLEDGASRQLPPAHLRYVLIAGVLDVFLDVCREFVGRLRGGRGGPERRRQGHSGDLDV